MSSETLHEQFDALSDETKDLHRAIVSLMEELEAVDWYNQRVDAATDEAVRDRPGQGGALAEVALLEALVGPDDGATPLELLPPTGDLRQRQHSSHRPASPPSSSPNPPPLLVAEHSSACWLFSKISPAPWLHLQTLGSLQV